MRLYFSYLFFLFFIFFFFFVFLFLFFFQAEDGIRVRDVTGVQTCALPICGRFTGVGFWAVAGFRATACRLCRTTGAGVAAGFLSRVIAGFAAICCGRAWLGCWCCIGLFGVRAGISFAINGNGVGRFLGIGRICGSIGFWRFWFFHDRTIAVCGYAQNGDRCRNNL